MNGQGEDGWTGGRGGGRNTMIGVGKVQRWDTDGNRLVPTLRLDSRIITVLFRSERRLA